MQIKRAFRTLRTRAHPDKGGDPEEFHRLVEAYNVLFDPIKVSVSLAKLSQSCKMTLLWQLLGSCIEAAALQPGGLKVHASTRRRPHIIWLLRFSVPMLI